MSLITAFIAELIRAANEADRLTYYQISRLWIVRSRRSVRCEDRPASLATVPETS